MIGCLLAVICKTCNFLYHGCRKRLKDSSYSETVAVFFHHIEATASYVYMVVVEIESLITENIAPPLSYGVVSIQQIALQQLIALLSNSDRGCCLTFL